ncbi:hypothetical protein PN36_17305 [Candidatus Thiomargarita nelsonii]|uniref:Secreted protein n=1 Tax=Candidatus Thiomargarita nelsonii TaxID=1003181 RepID=A0A0A6PDE9_9GAMM|nr:hypothetical protein PN36_17305 [Candidatus Thiomargarita nelsonii]
MLKKAIVMSIALPMSIGLGPSAIADETGGLADFSASVGLKVWENQWNVPSDELNQIISFRSENEIVLIPVLSFRYKKFFISGSYFPETDYSLGEQTVIGEISVEQGADQAPTQQYVGLLTELSAERSEWDINVGYYLSPFLVITAGYKKIERSFTGEIKKELLSPTEEKIVKEPFHFGTKTDGLTIGIAGVAPLQGKLGLYGNFALGWLETSEKDKDNFDSGYRLGELGFLYSSRFEQIPMLNAASFYAGYRFQVVKDDMPIGNGADDTTEGFVLGVNLTF